MENIKRCEECGRFLGESAFGLVTCRSGSKKYVYLRPRCNKCRRSRKWIRRHVTMTELVRSRGRKNARLYRDRHPERVQAYRRRYYQKHGDVHDACGATARARKLNQTPPDANTKVIRMFYAVMKRLNKTAGFIKYHVDHIHPVSKGGLHHEDNLQIMLAVDNMKKGAKII